MAELTVAPSGPLRRFFRRRAQRARNHSAPSSATSPSPTPSGKRRSPERKAGDPETPFAAAADGKGAGRAGVAIRGGAVLTPVASGVALEVADACWFGVSRAGSLWASGLTAGAGTGTAAIGTGRAAGLCGGGDTGPGRGLAGGALTAGDRVGAGTLGAVGAGAVGASPKTSTDWAMEAPPPTTVPPSIRPASHRRGNRARAGRLSLSFRYNLRIGQASLRHPPKR